MLTRFHYAFNVKDIPSTREFYINILGCEEGRSTDQWIDFNFFGHQLSAHIADIGLTEEGDVDSLAVPTPHFGCIVSQACFDELASRMTEHNVSFIYKPILRYKGKQAEQTIMFVKDFSGNVLEFKTFKNDSAIFM